ncbi:hypothetical protein C8Q73DRAFT_706310 [Cubamyces lactineus]|nr:hypothetical protein C8Q73DRAFT_706310 [Cubamyces lactineus]
MQCKVRLCPFRLLGSFTWLQQDVEDRITSSELLIPESNPNHTIGSPCEPSRSAVSTTADIYAWRSRQSAFSLDNDADSTLHEDELADDSDRDGRSPSTLSIGGSPGPIQQFSTVDIAPARTSHPSSPTSDQPIQHVESARELAVATVGETTETTLGHLRQASSATELDRHDPPLHEDSVDSIDSPLDDADWFRTSSPRSPRPLSVLPGLPLVSLDELLLDSDDSANCLGLSFRSDVSPVPSRTRARPQSPEWLVDDSVSLELETACSTARRLLVTEDYSAPSTLSRSSSITGSVSGLDEEDEEDYAVEGEDDDGWAQVHKGLGCVALAGLVAFLYLAVLAY